MGRRLVAGLIVPLVLIGCATHRTGEPAERAIVSVTFVEPLAVRPASGEPLLLRSLVGRVADVQPHGVRVRVGDAITMEGRSAVEALEGRVVTVPRAGSARLSILREDHARRDTAVVIGFPTLAFLVGFIVGRVQ